MVILRGWKFATFITAVVGAVGVATYPIIIDPMLNTDRYKQMQKINRAGINQKEIQPGNMNVWTDPFDKKK